MLQRLSSHPSRNWLAVAKFGADASTNVWKLERCSGRGKREVFTAPKRCPTNSIISLESLGRVPCVLLQTSAERSALLTQFCRGIYLVPAITRNILWDKIFPEVLHIDRGSVFVGLEFFNIDISDVVQMEQPAHRISVIAAIDRIDDLPSIVVAVTSATGQVGVSQEDLSPGDGGRRIHKLTRENYGVSRRVFRKPSRFRIRTDIAHPVLSQVGDRKEINHT